MVKTIKGLTYRDLAQALIQLGFVERETEDARSYLHKPSDAFIVFPRLPQNEPVRVHHLLTARGTVDGFNIMVGDDFDLLLLRLAGPQIPAETA